MRRFCGVWQRVLVTGALLLPALTAPAATFHLALGATNRPPAASARTWTLDLQMDRSAVTEPAPSGPAEPAGPAPVSGTNTANTAEDTNAAPSGVVYITTNRVLFFDNATKTTTSLVQVITNFIPAFRPGSTANRFTNDQLKLDFSPTTQDQGPIEVDSAIRLVLGGRTNLVVTDALGRSTNIQFTGPGLTNLAAVPGAAATNAVIPPAESQARRDQGKPALDVILSAYQVPSLESRFTGWGLLLLATAEHPPLFPGLNHYSVPTLLTNLAAPIPAWFSTNAPAAAAGTGS